MILNSILDQYAAATGPWFHILFAFANKLFWMLALIELAWVGILMVLKRRSGEDAFVELLRFIFAVGFAYAILLNAHIWLPAIIDSFMMAGNAASGLETLDPSSVFDQGLAISGKMMATVGILGMFSNPITTTVTVCAIIITIVAFAIIAALLLVTLVKSYVVIGGGVLLLGFGGSRWTRPVTERYLSYALAVGVQLFVMYLVIAVGNTIAQLWAEGLVERAAGDVQVYFEVLGGSIVYLFLAWTIPGSAYEMMHGCVTFNMHEGERMAVTGGSVGAVGGQMAWGGAAMMAHGGASGMGAIAAVGQRLLAGPSGGGGGTGGQSGGGGQSQGGSANNAAVLSRFRGAGQSQQANTGSAASSSSASTPTANLSNVQNPQVRAHLQRFANLGKP